MEVVRVLAAIAGGVLVLLALLEAFRTFVVPRGLRLRLSRPVTRSVFRGLGAIAKRLEVERGHGLMVHAGPLAVMALPLTWLVISWLGYSAIFWAVDAGGFGHAVVISGSSLFTLGFDKPRGVGGAIAAFSEAAVGLALLAVVISYLPSLNAGFARRESLVAMLDARAGTPPSALTLIERHYTYAGVEHFDQLWPEWEQWIVDVGQSHTTHPLLTLFRSAEPAHSWVIAAGAMVDAANLRLSAVQSSGPGNASAWFFYRAATGVLARLAGFFRLDLRPVADLDRGEFDTALEHLTQVGVPLVDDRDLAWERLNRRRQEYEPIVAALGRLVDAPERPAILYLTPR
jgi:hypothetical protein